MKPSLNRGNLRTDLDAQGNKILNLPADQPLPPPIIPDGSITDIKIHPTAAIQQSKLALTDDIPPSFLGTTATTAAQGDLAEYKANKAQPNGYPSLDSGGKIPAGQLPALAGTGTVTSVSVATANGVSGSVANATTTPAITVALGNIAPTTVVTSGTGGNGFLGLTSQSVDPAVSAGQFRIYADSTWRLSLTSPAGSSGTNGHYVKIAGASLTADRQYVLPDQGGVVALTSDVPTAMVGVGTGHKGGTVPDTGASGAGTDFLARDGTWKSAATFAAPSYQPTAVFPVIFAGSNTTGPRVTTLGNNGQPGGIIFFVIQSVGTTPTSGFAQYTGAFSLPPLWYVFAYQASTGYINSVFSSYQNPNTS